MISKIKSKLKRRAEQALVSYTGDDNNHNFNHIMKVIQQSRSNVTSILERGTLFTLTELTKGNIIELGTYVGLSSLVFANALKGTGRKLYTVDMFNREMGDTKSREAFLFQTESQYQLATRTLKENDYLDTVEVFKGTTEEFYIANKDKIKDIDLIFIDANHSFEGVLADINQYSTILNKGGFLVMHDYLSPRWKGVKEAVDLFLEKNKGVYSKEFVIGSMAILKKM